MKGILIAGPKASGKSTLAAALQATGRFQVVQAITTRSARPDDAPGQYEHVTAANFGELVEAGEMLLHDEHGSHRYGIHVAAVKKVVEANQVPVLVLTPATALKLAQAERLGGPPAYMTVFVDAPDEELDRRLRERDPAADLEAARRQRVKDREQNALFTYNIQGTVALTPLMEALWEHRGKSGLLPRRLALPLITAGTLLRNADPAHVQPASYDLRLGDEYFQHGKIKRVSEHDPLLIIEPFDYAIVTTREHCHFPNDVAGRFDLSVSMFAQGIVLSNSTQVDPGFRGPLFCLLSNTSSSKVMVKRGHHFATLELHKLSEPVQPYREKYQDKTLVTYLPANAAQGALNELKRDVDDLRKQNRQLMAWLSFVVTLFMAIVTLALTLR
jgi:deoxycytidine triphosphate deaminase